MIEKNDRDQTHRYPVAVRDYTFRSGRLWLSGQDNLGGELPIEITFYRNGVVGVKTGGSAAYEPEYDFIQADCRQPDEEAQLKEEENTLRIAFCGYQVSISKRPYAMTILDASGRIILQDSVDDVDSVGEGMNRIAPLGLTQGADGAVLGANAAFLLRQDEHIYGLGERFTEFDKRGQQVVMKNFDTLGCRDENSYKNIPFYLSTYGYGLFVNTPLMAQFNVGYESIATLSIHTPEKGMEYLILLGENLKRIVSKFTQLTGPAALPPDWSFGLWFSTGFKDSSRRAVEQDAALLRQKQIPCDVLHFDCYWLREDMWCDFVWDDALYPDRVEMLRGLKAQGFKICLWINPYVTVKTQMYEEGARKGYFVKNSAGEPYTADLWHGLLSLCVMVDFTNPEAERWYRQKVASVLLEGVDVVKTDFGEEIPFDAVFYNGKTGEQMRNLYSRLYNKAVYETVGENKGAANALVWARSGCAGMQQFPVCWSGDPRSSWACMASTLRGGLSLGISGVPFWSHDMGGFYGEVKEAEFIRWCQFGLFSSHSRLHGTTAREPWAYGARAEKILTDFIRLRYRLMPYILKTARQCVRQGLPFLRAMVLEHPDDPTVYGISDQYYFGADLLVAPIFGGDNAQRRIYLPQGNWTDFLRGDRHQGGQWLTVQAPLEYMPIFVREGAQIEMNETIPQHL